MIIQIILSLFLGIIAGTFTGLTPGIHINLIGAILVSLSTGILSSINPIFLVVFITAMAIAHTFIDFIPSIFLGCPDTNTELSILPGHELLKQGHGYQAVLLTAYGGLAAIFILLLITFPSILILSHFYDDIQKIIPYILIILSGILILLENKKFQAMLVFFLTGFLGWSVLNLELSQPLLPLLTGLFGASSLILSIKTNPQIPKQKIVKPKINIIKPVIGALLASPICSFLPGLGSGQAAIIGYTFSLNKEDKRGFLVLLGAVNILVMGLSFVSLYAISKTRTGAAASIKEILSGNILLSHLIIMLITVLISGLISFYLTCALSKFCSENINKINYSKMSIITLIVLVIIVGLISKFSGLLVFIITTLTGIYCISLGVRRTNMMGCLLIPTIIYYLF